MLSFNNLRTLVLVTVAIACGAAVKGNPIAAVFDRANAVRDDVCDRTYVVQAGDFCDKISAAQNVSTYQLATVNSAIINPTCSNLFIGETLCLGFEGSDCETIHVVAAGDGCASIASAANITLADLLTNNPNIDEDCTNIYGGEVLCVAPVA